MSVVYCLLSFSSCNQSQNQIPVVGEIDSVAIASDTAMQLGLESSYEFHKTLVVNENLVYDVVGFGGPASSGEFAILRRGGDNKADTVMKQQREGIIADAFLADSNRNNKQEVYVVVRNPSQAAMQKTFRFEPADK